MFGCPSVYIVSKTCKMIIEKVKERDAWDVLHKIIGIDHQTGKRCSDLAPRANRRRKKQSAALTSSRPRLPYSFKASQNLFMVMLMQDPASNHPYHLGGGEERAT
eukprot:755592-Hanusia_phi.AAC.2